MKLRSVIALLVLANYLFLAGMGCISRPEQDSFVVLMQAKSAESQRYESRRYLRTQDIEAFMLEALATRYSKTSDTHNPHLLSVVSGIELHTLPDPFQTTVLPSLSCIPISSAYKPLFPQHIAFAIYSPPEVPRTA